MRYAKEHKQATHERIVKSAAQRFRKDGVDAVGVASLMADAGLTHGGFYSHFETKDALVGEAVAAALDDTLAELTRRAGNAEHGLEAIVRAYLSPRHRDHPETGCAAASLAAELARQSPSTRGAFSAGLQALFALLETQLPAAVPAGARRGRAIALFAGMLGSLQLARAVDDPALSKRILENGIQAALILATAP